MTTATEATPARRDRTLNLPFVTATFHVPDVRLPRPPMPRVPVPSVPRVGRAEATHAAKVAAGYLPAPERLAYYAGLGVLGVAGLIEWPVAAAIAAGTVVAQRGRREQRHEEGRDEGATTGAGRRETASGEGRDKRTAARTERPARGTAALSSTPTAAKKAATKSTKAGGARTRPRAAKS
jgi:hypothetical protein